MRESTAERMARYEGLVIQTARMHARLLRREEEDLCQEFRLKVLKVLGAYDPTRSRLDERKYVFGCLTNFVTDMKRTSAKEAARTVEVFSYDAYVSVYRGQVSTRISHGVRGEELDLSSLEYGSLEPVHDINFELVEDEEVAGITDREKRIVELIGEGYNCEEIGSRLGLSGASVRHAVKCLREKFAILNPALRRDQGSGIPRAA